MNNFCSSCPDRSKCIKLCEAAEQFVDQDHVCRREALEGEINIEIDKVVEETEWPAGEIELNENDWKRIVDKTNMTKLQKKYTYEYYVSMLSYKQIAKKYNTTRQNIRLIILRGKLEIAKVTMKSCPDTK